MKRWISEDILSWHAYRAGGDSVSEEVIERSYQLLSRAEHFIGGASPSADDRADCVGSLRKSVTHRNRIFEEAYNLRGSFDIGKKKHYLQLLADFNIVRPMLLKGLLDIRNEIEYNDVEPPGVSECKKLADIVWYFLRSTDPLIRTTRSELELDRLTESGRRSPYGGSLDIKFSPLLNIQFAGWVTPEMISGSAQENFIEIRTKTFHTRQEWWGEKTHLDKAPDDIWVIGKLNPTPEQKYRIFRFALETY